MTGASPAGAARVLELVRGAAPAGPGELDKLFGELEPVPAEFMLGTWAGGVFDQADAMAAMLVRMRWYGKRFHDAEHVEPLLCRGEDGALTSFTGMGLARLREMAHRGVVSAAMVYDTQPIIDHFRRVSGDVVLGAMDAKDAPDVLYFHLTRAAEG
ncbi:DUF4334 domain-containing protein [Actinomadura xylanilytica]|uniref:DUF4334 domain-containing protein n=1 Tax=Actinomadura xylanilytica TaxID=887459 RepID=UPI00255A7F30|nr:DUF4334 domain-containing protein [Actinomadura xylanilytica]MDL4773757.1 DUF4334 domain-containing protein [Actinomadura xylanilytica]